MPTPLKDVYTDAYLGHLSHTIQQLYPAFESRAFMHQVFDQGWPERALKARMQHIAESLHDTLALPYPEALAILTPAAVHFSGFEAMFFPEYVRLYGLNHWDDSITALAHLTEYSSSEFAVRAFIVQDSEKMMAQMLRWAHHANPHIRRLASEGCRPRLPWATALEAFKQDPSPILPVLAALKQDDSLYVRKSVANNLNDIAKDHPATLLDLTARWLGQHPHTDWILKHGCRTLLKQGHAAVLPLFGFHPPTHVRVHHWQVEAEVTLGETLHFDFQLRADQALGHLRLEYVLGLPRLRGKISQKVFKIAEGHYPAHEKTVQKTHAFRALTTRTYYPGTHHLSLLVNGQTMAESRFTLKPAKS